MEKLTQDLQEYLHEVLNISIELRPWKGQLELPFFLIDAYNFYQISLFEHPCLLMVIKKDTEITPGVIHKHCDQVQKKWGGFSIYVQSAISSYNRKRLIEHNIPFIVPGNQMYLPQLGIDLREYFQKIHNREHKFFSPGTQTVVLYALVHETNEKLSPSLLAERLGYTLMTMTRAFKELESTGIGEIHQKGREYCWIFPKKKELWEQVKPFLRTPTKKRIWLKHTKPEVIAGLSALSQFSMINPPNLPVYAISAQHWREWKQLDVKEIPSPEDADFELEIWNYDPKLFAKNDIVDPFSLYLSLKDFEDERIESALIEMMENVAW
jgi:DNA-binding MarR family transcriptional regulator